MLWASKKIFNTARYFSSIIQLLFYQRINSFTELNSLCLEIRQLMKNGGRLSEALELAVSNVRSFLICQINLNNGQNQVGNEDVDCLNKLIDKWDNL